MVTSVDRVSRPLAKKMIAKFGKRVELVKRTVGVYNDATGTAPVQTSVTTPYAVLEGYSERAVNGTSVQVGDIRMTMAAMDAKAIPDVDDEVRFDNVSMRVINLVTGFSGEEVAIYQVQLRR